MGEAWYCVVAARLHDQLMGTKQEPSFAGTGRSYHQVQVNKGHGPYCPSLLLTLVVVHLYLSQSSRLCAAAVWHVFSLGCIKQSDFEGAVG